MQRPEKVLFPKEKITKKEISAYYAKVAKLMLPHLKNRPLVMERFPDGIGKEGFFQKNIKKSFPKWISTIQVKRKSKGAATLILCQNKKTLLFLVDQACITFHTWLSQKGKLDCPDRMVFDLDPSSKNLLTTKKAAQALKQLLEKEFHLKPFLMTTGSKGFHLVVPIRATRSFDEVRDFAKKIAELICDQDPKSFTTAVRKAKRKNRVFIDYLRNSYAQHSVVPYSLRPLAKAPIAKPIEWSELSDLRPQSFSLKKPALSQKDPWRSFQQSRKSITQSMISKLEKLIQAQNQE